MTEILRALHYAAANNIWVVLVSPQKELEQYSKSLSLLIPPEVIFSGRTALLSTGKISIVSETSPMIFEAPFIVLLLPGCGVTKWQKTSISQI
jgi:hypothetical protein